MYLEKVQGCSNEIKRRVPTRAVEFRECIIGPTTGRGRTWRASGRRGSSTRAGARLARSWGNPQFESRQDLYLPTAHKIVSRNLSCTSLSSLRMSNTRLIVQNAVSGAAEREEMQQINKIRNPICQMNDSVAEANGFESNTPISARESENRFAVRAAQRDRRCRLVQGLSQLPIRFFLPPVPRVHILQISAGRVRAPNPDKPRSSARQAGSPIGQFLGLCSNWIPGACTRETRPHYLAS